MTRRSGNSSSFLDLFLVRLSVAFGRLPASQGFVRPRYRGIHDFAVDPGAGGQFDDVAIGVAEVDRAHKPVIDRTAHLAALRLSFLQHALESVVLDAERDVQIERILLLEVERRARHLEEGEAGAVIHLEEGMKRTAPVDLKGADQTKTEEILVKGPRLLR